MPSRPRASAATRTALIGADPGGRWRGPRAPRARRARDGPLDRPRQAKDAGRPPRSRCGRRSWRRGSAGVRSRGRHRPAQPGPAGGRRARQAGALPARRRRGTVDDVRALVAEAVPARSGRSSTPSAIAGRSPSRCSTGSSRPRRSRWSSPSSTRGCASSSTSTDRRAAGENPAAIVKGAKLQPLRRGEARRDEPALDRGGAPEVRWTACSSSTCWSRVPTARTSTEEASATGVHALAGRHARAAS